MWNSVWYSFKKLVLLLFFSNALHGSLFYDSKLFFFYFNKTALSSVTIYLMCVTTASFNGIAMETEQGKLETMAVL